MIEGCPTLFNGFDLGVDKTSVAPLYSQGTKTSRKDVVLASQVEAAALICTRRGWQSLCEGQALRGMEPASREAELAGSSGERVQGARVNVTCCLTLPCFRWRPITQHPLLIQQLLIPKRECFSFPLNQFCATTAPLHPPCDPRGCEILSCPGIDCSSDRCCSQAGSLRPRSPKTKVVLIRILL